MGDEHYSGMPLLPQTYAPALTPFHVYVHRCERRTSGYFVLSHKRHIQPYNASSAKKLRARCAFAPSAIDKRFISHNVSTTCKHPTMRTRLPVRCGGVCAFAPHFPRKMTDSVTRNVFPVLGLLFCGPANTAISSTIVYLRILYMSLCRSPSHPPPSFLFRFISIANQWPR